MEIRIPKHRCYFRGGFEVTCGGGGGGGGAGGGGGRAEWGRGGDVTSGGL